MQLAANTVHIWLTQQSLIPATAFPGYYALMSPAERNRNLRYTSQALRDTDATTRALLRTVLSQYDDCAPSHWEFDTAERGKPHIASPGSSLFFNVSHSSAWVVCAIARFPVLGVDIEHCNRDVDVLRLAQRFFSPQEYSDLRSSPVDIQKSRFFDYWTLKESYIKARGEGIALGLDKFSFRLPENGTIAIECDAVLQDNPGAWHFRLSRGTGDHRLALAVKPPQPTRTITICHFRTIPQHSIDNYSGPLQLQETV